METYTPYYVYDGKFWISVLTRSDNDSFFHSTYGFRANENEPYIDKCVAEKRRNWSNFLTSFENKSMPPSLIDILKRCFTANEKYKDASVKDKAQLANYASDIEAAVEPVNLEEIPFLAAFDNFKIVILTKGRCDIVEPDLRILGHHRRRAFVDNYRNIKSEAVLSFEETIFSKLVVADEKLTNQYQVDYLVSYWMRKLNFQDSVRNKCERYAKTLLNSMFSWMKMCHHLKIHFTDVWLQMTILAEIFQENGLPGETEWEGCKEYLKEDRDEPKLLEKMSLVKLFDMFVEKKQNVFMDTANGDGQALVGDFEECLNSHRILALETVLDKAKCELFMSYQQCNENFEINLSKIGIAKKFDDEFRFVHDKFKEYFFVEAILRELRNQNKNADFQRFLFEEILSCSEFNAIRAFMDNRLQTTESLPSNIFQNYQSQKYDIDFSKSYLQCTIHLLAKEGCLAVLKLLLKCFNFRPVVEKNITLAYIFETQFDKDTWKQILGNSFSLLRYLSRHGGVNIKDREKNMPLHYAAEHGQLETVKFLIEQGANVDDPGNDSQTALHLSALGGHLDTVKFLLQHDANVEKTTSEGYRALHLAVFGGHFDTVKFLVEIGAKINLMDNDGLSPLHLAAKKGQLKVIKFFVERGGDVCIRGNNGPTTLHVALSENHTDVARYLVDQGAQVNIKYDKGRTPLHVAASNGVDGVKLLLENGADIDVTDKDGCTALHLAVSEEHLDAVKFLLQSGANSNIKNNRGNAPLHLAALYKKGIDLVKCLIENGANINIRDEDGCTALFLAVQRDCTNISQYLLEHGPNINITNNEGYSALHCAVYTNQLDKVKSLMTQGADINTRDSDESTPLHLAVLENNLDIVKLLIENGANVTARDTAGRTPLHLAASNCYLHIVRVLAECGDVDAGNRLDETALHAAVDNDHLDIIKTLMQHGVDVNKPDIYDQTPLYSALLRDQINVIKFLVENGARADFKRTKYCSTVLHFVALKCKLATFKYFMERDPDFDIRGSNGTTAFLLAAKGGRTDTIQFLMECGVDINTMKDDGRTALHLAAKSDEFGTVRLLIGAAMDVNSRDKEGRTPFHLAAKSGSQSVLKFLIERIRDINERDAQGRTALHLATLKNRLGVVKYLVGAGIDVRITDNDGFTALHLATLWCHCYTELIRYLELQNRGKKRQLND